MNPGYYLRRYFCLFLLFIPLVHSAQNLRKHPVARWLEELKDKPQAEAGSRAFTLEQIGPDTLGAAHLLIEALYDSSPHIRSYAIHAMGAYTLVPQQCLPALRRMLRDESEMVRMQTSLALSRYGLRAMPTLISTLDEQPPPFDFITHGPKAPVSIPALHAALSFELLTEKYPITYLMGRLSRSNRNKAQHNPYLRSILPEEYRQTIADSPTGPATNLLRLVDARQKLRKGELTDKEVYGLQKMLYQPDSLLRYQAFSILMDAGKLGLPAIGDAFNRGHLSLKQQFCRWISESFISEEQLLYPHLSTLLYDPEPEIRAWALGVLPDYMPNERTETDRLFQALSGFTQSSYPTEVYGALLGISKLVKYQQLSLTTNQLGPISTLLTEVPYETHLPFRRKGYEAIGNLHGSLPSINRLIQVGLSDRDLKIRNQLLSQMQRIPELDPQILKTVHQIIWQGETTEQRMAAIQVLSAHPSYAQAGLPVLMQALFDKEYIDPQKPQRLAYRTQLLQAIEQGGAEGVQDLFSLYRHRDPFYRKMALSESIRLIGHDKPRCLSEINRLLVDPNVEVRKAALNLIAQERVFDTTLYQRNLLLLVEKPLEQDIDLLINVLAKYTDDLAPVFRTHMAENPDPEIRIAMTYALTRLDCGYAASVEEIITPTLREGSDYTRTVALGAINHCDALYKQYEEEIPKLLEDAAPTIRTQAIGILVQRRPMELPAFEEAWIKLLADISPKVRLAAIEWLSLVTESTSQRMAHSESEPTLAMLYTDLYQYDPNVIQALQSVRTQYLEFFPNYIPRFRSLLSDTSPEVQQALLKQLRITGIRAQTMIPDIIESSHQDSDSLTLDKLQTVFYLSQSNSAQAASATDWPIVQEYFLEYAREGSPGVRAQAIHYLAGLGKPEQRVVETLQQALDDSSAHVTAAASRGLVRLAPFGINTSQAVFQATQLNELLLPKLTGLHSAFVQHFYDEQTEVEVSAFSEGMFTSRGLNTQPSPFVWLSAWPQASSSQALPNNWFGSFQDTLPQVFQRVMKALNTAGYRNHVEVFRIDGGLAVLTHPERHSADFSSAGGLTRWAPEPPTRPDPQAYLQRLTLAPSGDYRAMLLTFQSEDLIPPFSSEAMASTDFRGMESSTESIKLPIELQAISLENVNVTLHVYQLKKYPSGRLQFVAPSAEGPQAENHLVGSRIKSHLIEQ